MCDVKISALLAMLSIISSLVPEPLQLHNPCLRSQFTRPAAFGLYNGSLRNIRKGFEFCRLYTFNVSASGSFANQNKGSHIPSRYWIFAGWHSECLVVERSYVARLGAGVAGIGS